jgi:hypothetical protein
MHEFYSISQIHNVHTARVEIGFSFNIIGKKCSVDIYGKKKRVLILTLAPFFNQGG